MAQSLHIVVTLTCVLKSSLFASCYSKHFAFKRRNNPKRKILLLYPFSG